jgi:sugar lactone lactonase YvrE
MNTLLGTRIVTVGTLILILTMSLTTVVRAAAPGNAAFQRTWERTDRPVFDGKAARTWMWGPVANTQIMTEAYVEAPDGMREVQYYDKARMEITYPDGDASSIWYVTNGLLVVELVSGRMQVGDNQFEQHTPAVVNVAGDADDSNGPTYATFGALLNAAPRALGSVISARLSREGHVTDDPSLTAQAVTVRFIDDVTNHAIAAPFWDFMNSSGPVYANDQLITSQLFESSYFATGRPITDAYWANVKVGGQQRDVLMQCFERRCLTYTPGNPDGFVVEAGNVGQHYYEWRYGNDNGSENETPEPPVTQPPANEPPADEPPATQPPADEPPATQPPADESPAMPAPATVYQFAGSRGDAMPQNSEITNPTGTALAPNGNLYVVDGANRVQVFDSDGVWLRSWGTQGSGSGQFDNPQGIAADSLNNIYVADFANHRIEKFDPEGAFLDAWPVDGFPSDIAYGPAANKLFVTDSSKHLVRVYSTDGVQQNVIGSSGSDPGQLFVPMGLTVGPDGNIYVADTLNNRIQVFSAEGEFLGGFGSVGTGPGQFRLPSDVAVTTGSIIVGLKIYVADSLNDRIQVYNQEQVLAPPGSRQLSGLSYSYASEFGTSGTEPGQFERPEGLEFDRNGNLIVADMRNGRIQTVSTQGNPLDSLYDGSRGRLGGPTGLAVGADGRLYVSDITRNASNDFVGAIQVFGQFGEFSRQWANLLPGGVAVDHEGNLIVLNLTSGHVETYSPDGELIDGWGPGDVQARILISEMSIALDAEDNVYILSTGTASIQKYSSDGHYLGSWGANGSQPGQFKAASGIAIHGDEVYIADADNNRVQVFTLDGMFLREWGSLGTDDGQFVRPSGVAVDSYGYVYVADPSAHRIQKFTPDGQFIAKILSVGVNGQPGNPYEITVDQNGTIYTIDNANLRVEVYVPVQ